MVSPTFSVAQTCDVEALRVATTAGPEWSEYRRPTAAERLAAMPENIDLLLLGDSLMNFWPSDIMANVSRGQTFWNYAFSGDRTKHALGRLDMLPISRLSPRKVLIWIGTNNMGDGQPACAIVAGIQKLIDNLEKKWAGIEIGVISIPPRGADFRDYEEVRKAVNLGISSIAEKTPGVTQINLPDNVLACRIGAASRANKQCANYLAGDLHFSRDGYELISRQLVKFIDNKR